jgi:predicted HNH restriction endonuclease
VPYKDSTLKKTKDRAYAAKYYQGNKESVKARAKEARKEKRVAWQEYKSGLTCTVCGFSHPAAIDFHHPPGTKKHAVNALIKNGRYALAYKEASKCVILCANCHRIHHYEEKGA